MEAGWSDLPLTLWDLAKVTRKPCTNSSQSQIKGDLKRSKDLRRVFTSLRLHKIILNSFCSFVPLINIRNKKMKSWSHPTSPTLEYNQEPSTMLPHYSPTFPTLPPHYPHTPFPPSQLTTLPTFPPSQLRTLPPFSAHHPPNDK